MGERYDVVVAGGAVMGSSIACHLAMLGNGRLKVLVVEPDPTYARSASALSAGSIRQQFSTDVNIDISLYGIDFLRDIGERLAVDGDKPEIGLHEGGYLYVAGEAGASVLREVNTLQRARGADILHLDAADLAQRFPWLSLDGVAAGNFGTSGEGWFDGYGLMMAFRRKARAIGVEYRKARVAGFEMAAGRIGTVILDNGEHIGCGAFVNAAGASGARALSDAMGFAIPVRAKKRCVFSFATPDALPGFPLLIDTTGVWVRPEGRDFIAGFSPDDLDDADCADDFEVDWSLFEGVIWPALAHRVPALERLRPGRAWAGHYDMCLLDHNALVGPVPGVANAWLAAGFSGHGLQQSPAVGRGVAELIVAGGFRTLDLSDLSPERLISGKPLLERNII